MENKIKLKKYLIITFVISLILLILFLIINVYEYSTYTKNFNKKINSIILKVKEKYPNVTNEEIMQIINNNSTEESIFKEYGIYIEKDSLLLENDNSYQKFLTLNIVFFISTILILLFLFLKYDNNKNKEISNITKYIEEINKKNYTLHIDEISEDELSILKNEIYKTTITLKENAENSLKDKKELKKSLEDISHQLKTPLTSILVMLDNIIDNPDMDIQTREEFARDIKREVTNINFLVQAILKLSKFDVNAIHFIQESRLLKDIVDESTKKVSTLCDLKNITIDIKGNKQACIKCDFMWQVEAITNIIKNCIEHSKENNKIIVEYEQNNAYSSIIIQDFGEGIDSKDLPHIFERFYKGKNASSDSVGIGLALSKAIIEKDNGTINVESNTNGTKFIIKYYKY
ncbi:MAG: sensor histidine kinase [Clostridia bacterium]